MFLAWNGALWVRRVGAPTRPAELGCAVPGTALDVPLHFHAGKPHGIQDYAAIRCLRVKMVIPTRRQAAADCGSSHQENCGREAANLRRQHHLFFFTVSGSSF